MVQLLTPEGVRVEHPDYPLEITDEEIQALYRDLVLVRRVDTEAIALQRQGELGLWASLLGQEGAQVGAGRALRPHDMAFPTYREHGVAWCRDVDPLVLLGLFRARRRCTRPATRWASSGTAPSAPATRTGTLPCWPSSATARPARVT
jgi:pyruvate dehydrogenase E1 component alpha subunit